LSTLIYHTELQNFLIAHRRLYHMTALLTQLLRSEPRTTACVDKS